MVIKKTVIFLKRKLKNKKVIESTNNMTSELLLIKNIFSFR